MESPPFPTKKHHSLWKRPKTGVWAVPDIQTLHVFGPLGVRCALCLRCVCAVCVLCKKQGVFRLVSPNGQADRGKYCVPIHWTARILTRSKNSNNTLKQTMFQIENARLLFKSAVFALRLYASPVVGGLQGSWEN